MRLPFTPAQFFDVFARYNAAIWPAQIMAYVLGIAALALAWRGDRRAGRLVAAVLAAFWAMAGAGYHLVFFRAINPVALPAGILFLGEALLLLLAGVVRDGLRFRVRRDATSALGLAFAAYALAVYPALNAAAGHAFMASPVFGVAPCPVTIFTFGMLLLSERPVPAWLLAIPFLWSLLGVSAAIQLRVPADYGLAVAGVLGTTVIVARDRRSRRGPAAS